MTNNTIGFRRTNAPLLLLYSCVLFILTTVPTASAVRVDSVAHPAWRNKQVYLFRAASAATAIQPVIFFCHGIGASDPERYLHLLSHMAERGFSVIYSPFKTGTAMLKPEKCYRMMMSGFEAGIIAWSEILDTTMIGVVGHSYGGGAVPGISRKMLVEHHWGTQSVFLYLMAPWFSYWIDQEQLESFPKHTLLLVQCFSEDTINDPRMGNDIFRSMGVPDERKGFIYLHSDTCGTPVAPAVHAVPEGTCNNDPDVNILDSCGIYPVFDALASHSIDHNPKKWNQLFSTASHMSSLQLCSDSRDGTEVFRPIPTVPLLPEVMYVNFWHHYRNPRAHAGQSSDSSKDCFRANSKTTLWNYFSHFFYPAKIRGQEEDFLEDGYDDWDEKLEYRDTASYDRIIAALENNRECGPMPIRHAYGARGSHAVTQRFVPHSGIGQRDIYIHLPAGREERFPLLLFAPGKIVSANNYRELCFHLASRGYVVVSSSFGRNPFTRDEKQFTILNEGFAIGIELCRGIIDTSRIGFIGHSYGVRALLPCAAEYLTRKKWGAVSSFLFAMSPKAFTDVDRINTKRLPGSIESIILVFDDDFLNDWRDAKKLFYALPGDVAKKRFFIGHSYEGDGCELEASFSAPFCRERDDDCDGIDEYVIFRSIDILMDHSFNNNNDAFENAGFSNESIGMYRVQEDGIDWRAITYSLNADVLPERKSIESD